MATNATQQGLLINEMGYDCTGDHQIDTLSINTVWTDTQQPSDGDCQPGYDSRGNEQS